MAALGSSASALHTRLPRGPAVLGLRAAIARAVYVPAVVLALGAGALVAAGWASGWGGQSFAASLTDLRIVLVGPATLCVLGALLVIERLRPAQRRPLVARGHVHDLLYAVLNATLVAPLVVALTTSSALLLRRSTPWIVAPRIPLVPHWAFIAIVLVAMDFCNWFAHLCNHRVRVMWRFHELHHSQEDMNALTVFRTHPLIHVSYLIALLPGIVLLANGIVPTTLVIVYASLLALEHSNTNLGFGPLERLIVSPNYHRIHHRLVGRQDVNLGFVLTIWDQLSGRAVFPTPDTIRADTGLPGRPLRVEQSGRRPRHLAVISAQLAGPFRPLATVPVIDRQADPTAAPPSRADGSPALDRPNCSA